MPAISVIMSVYDEPVEWIRQSIDSILSQTFTDFEFIIINDNPDGEDQKQLLEKYAAKDSRIKLIENETNLGLAASLNKGIKVSSSIYIARMDADDISLSKRFEMQYEYMKKHPEISVCGTWAKLFGELPRLSYRDYKVPTMPQDAVIFAVFASPLLHPTIMARTEVMQEYMYNEECRKAQDYDLWSRMICNGVNVSSIPQFLLRYRVTAKSKTQESINAQNCVAFRARSRIIQSLNLSVDYDDIFIYSEICATGCPVLTLTDKSERLNKIELLLIQKFPSKERYIKTLINDYWASACLASNASFGEYWSSPLRFGFNRLTLLRFIKKILMNNLKLL